MRVQGVNVNDREIAEGLYALMDEHDLAMLSFGMLPSRMMDQFKESLHDRLLLVVENQFGLDMDGIRDLEASLPEIPGGYLSDDLTLSIRQIEKEVLHQVSLHLYSIHSQNGHMVV